MLSSSVAELGDLVQRRVLQMRGRRPERGWDVPELGKPEQDPSEAWDSGNSECPRCGVGTGVGTSVVWDERRFGAFPFTAFDFRPFHAANKRQNTRKLPGGQAETSGAGTGVGRRPAGPSRGVRSRGRFWSEAGA